MLTALLSLGVLGSPAMAWAEPPSSDGHALQEAPAAPRARIGADSWAPGLKALFVGIEGGVGFASVKHPSVATPHMVGPIMSFQVGYRVSPRWTVSLVYTDFQQSVARGDGTELFAASTQWLHTAEKCDNCKDPAVGGAALRTTFRLSTLGPSVDVTPFGRDGVFLGASGGLAIASILGASYGVAGTARAGFRLRPVANVALSLEGGAQGQAYTGGTAALGYGAAEARLSF